MKKNIIFAIFILLLGACKEKEISKPTEFEVIVIDENGSKIESFEFELTLFTGSYRFLLPSTSSMISLNFTTNKDGKAFGKTSKNQISEIALTLKNIGRRRFLIKPYEKQTSEFENSITIEQNQIKFKELNKIEIIRLKE